MHVRKLSTHLHTGSRKKISWESHNSVIPFRSIGSSAAFAQPRRLETIKRRAEEDPRSRGPIATHSRWQFTVRFTRSGI